MNKRLLMYLYTFFGVGCIIFFMGFIGINISLKYVQNKYIQLQVDVNKRQAEQMAFFLKKQIAKGESLDSVQHQFQEAIVGTETDKGFMCMYDCKLDQLVCHPNEMALGMKFSKEFVLQDIDTELHEEITKIYAKDQAVGGIFIQGGMRTDIIYSVPVEGTDWFVNAHENIFAISEEIKMLRFRYILGSLILGLFIAVAATITARKISRKYEKQIETKNELLDKNYNELQILHQQVQQQKSEIEENHRIVVEHRNEIARKNKQITDSISYAERIQTAVMPPIEMLNEAIPENFILYKPRDIVSGDFYWFSKVDDYDIVVAADCTGHGVPGAFMSMLGITILNELVNKEQISRPDLILNELRNHIKIALGQTKGSNKPKDGMDISLCVLNSKTLEMQFAGAYNNLYIIRKENENTDYSLLEVKADRMPIGIHPKDENLFTNNELQLNPDDRIYICSDGYESQFGGEMGHKFKSKQFKETLIAIQGHPFANHKDILNKTLVDWQGTNEQVDDILVMGLKV